MKIVSFLLLSFTLVLISACSHLTQTSSGKDYLAKHESALKASGGPLAYPNDPVRSEILKASKVEPTLTFPARIGIAKIENGSLIAIPQDEADAWVNTHKNLGNSFGEFVPVSILITEMATRTKRHQPLYTAIDQIRIGAARQHLDAVLIYEIQNKTNQKGNILRLGALTVIGGYFLPSESLDVEGIANAILIDVVQGYPYGTAQTTVEKNEFATTWGAHNRENKLIKEVSTIATLKLSEEVEEMFKKLRYELAENRLGNEE